MTKSNLKMSVEELEATIRRHNYLYFIEHKPEISDYKFDRFVKELKRRRPNSKILSEIGSDLISVANKVKHQVPMLSLDKCYDEETMDRWLEKFDGDVVASPKIDGCAVSVKYGSTGELLLAATRGKGLVGEEITNNAFFIKDIPTKIGLKSVEVRGEVYMKLSTFKKYKDEFANPRNLAAGAIKQKDPKKTGEYALSFWAYDLLSDDSKTEVEKRDRLKKNGFPVIEWKLVKKRDVNKIFDKFLSTRDKYDFETDGVVFKANDVREQARLSATIHHPRYAIAYKFQGDSGVTKLVDIEWSVARTGVITPVGIVEPVELSGATVTRVSLHNIGLMQKLKVGKGAKVMMMRRGGVIPNLESVVKPGTKKAELPRECPSCGGPVEVRDDFFYCVDPSKCVKAKIGQLKHFVQVVEIDGFGDVLLEKLYESGLVTDPAELYTLTKGDLTPLDRMGETLAAKLVKNVQGKRKIPLDLFMRSLGIRELGRHAASVLAGQYGTLNKLFRVSEEELAEIHTIGEIIANEVVSGLKESKFLIDKLLKHVKVLPVKRVGKAAKGPLAGKSFLFTGSMLSMGRKEGEKLVVDNGGEIASGVLKNLDYLVVGDGGGAGNKLTKAKDLIKKGEEIKILSEKGFLSLIKE